jgi:hypothetical protein
MIYVTAFILWHVDPLQGNDCEMDNGRYYATSHKQQQKNGVFCAFRADMLLAGQLWMSE